jgi:peptide/nickel transport system permease protein
MGSPGAAGAPGRMRGLWRVVRRDRFVVVCAAILTLLVLLAIFAPWIAPYPEQGLGRSNPATAGIPPSWSHPFGTDELGRDVLSRVLMGARPTLLVPFVVVGLAAAIGVPIGAYAGYRGGRLDGLLMRTTDLFLAFPSLLLAMVITALLGRGLLNATIALVVSWWPWYARLVRGVAASLRQRPFIEGARAMGVRDRVIVVRHIIPNATSPVLVQATIDLGIVILAMGGLAFLGLGTQPPKADWGLMIAEGRGSMLSLWWLSTFPGLAIFVAVMSFNVIGDGLRDIFDPREHR